MSFSNMIAYEIAVDSELRSMGEPFTLDEIPRDRLEEGYFRKMTPADLLSAISAERDCGLISSKPKQQSFSEEEDLLF